MTPVPVRDGEDDNYSDWDGQPAHWERAEQGAVPRGASNACWMAVEQIVGAAEGVAPPPALGPMGWGDGARPLTPEGQGNVPPPPPPPPAAVHPQPQAQPPAPVAVDAAAKGPKLLWLPAY